MKKIYIALAAFMTFGITSCDMDKYPDHVIEEGNYMRKYQDFADARIGLYPAFRGLTTGGLQILSDIQCDDFQASASFSNALGDVYRWEFQPSSGEMTNIYGGYYGEISSCNYFIDKYEDLMNDKISLLEPISSSQMENIKGFAGEAYTLRAYCYFMLANFYCKAYTQTDPNTALGLPLQLHVNNTPSDYGSYQKRSTLAQTFTQINSDLKTAVELFEAKKEGWGGAKYNVHYVNKYTAAAIQARVALYMGKYDEALAKAKFVLDEGATKLKKHLYTISEGDTENPEFVNMWINDTTDESIWQIFQSKDEQGALTGTYFLGQVDPKGLQNQKMDYFPSQDLINCYDQANDVRFQAYFGTEQIKVTTNGGTNPMWLFRKYSGNPELSKTQSDKYLNMSSPIRLAESYLIAAEAAAMLGQVADASKYLGELRTARILDYDSDALKALGKDELLKEIKLEYRREFVGENHRLLDLKRWGEGFARKASQNDDMIHPAGKNLSKDKSDYRFTWPIPKNESDMPVYKGQQNEGY